MMFLIFWQIIFLKQKNIILIKNIFRDTISITLSIKYQVDSNAVNSLFDILLYNWVVVFKGCLS
jgi:hypothetical protein